ncbi:MAG: hypothetical protein Q4B26_14415 [Eubacteriales bacterium]|nr:hypothetical protein [Eubacteriales bacterium]
MANANDTIGILQENLVDAGCNPRDIECCLNLAKNNRWSSMLPTLKCYRSQLLNTIHKDQSKLECLDYLIYKIGKEHKE